MDTIPRRLWIRLAVIYLFLGVAALVFASDADPEAWWLHGLWCFTGLAVALPVLSRAVLRGFDLVLTDHRLMFLGAFSLYFLFGAALLAVGPEIQAHYSLRFYPIDAREALRVDAVNGMGFGVALLASAFARGRWLGVQAGNVAAQAAKVPAHLAIGLLLVLGTAASAYLLSLDLGLRQGIAPGIVRTGGNLSLAAVFLASAHQGRGEWVLRLLGAVVAIGLALTGILLFNKSAALLPLASVTAGLALRFGSRRVLPLGLAVLIGGYLVLGDPTGYGRAAIGYGGGATLAERSQFLQEGVENTVNLNEDEKYGYWSRLCYTSAQAAALDLREAGQGGDGIRLIPWVFVPRLIASGKPEITKTGREFNFKITGQDSSSTGQGIFASGYYHGGWWGLVLASALCGWILAQTSAIARAIQLKNAKLMLPFSLLGLFIAFRIDGDFVADYLGSFVFILYPLLALALLLAVPRRRREGVPW